MSNSAPVYQWHFGRENRKEYGHPKIKISMRREVCSVGGAIVWKQGKRYFHRFKIIFGFPCNFNGSKTITMPSNFVFDRNLTQEFIQG